MKTKMTEEEMGYRDEVAMRVLPYFLRLDKVSMHSAYACPTEDDPDGINSDRRMAAVQAYRMADEMLFVRNKNINGYKG